MNWSKVYSLGTRLMFASVSRLQSLWKCVSNVLMALLMLQVFLIPQFKLQKVTLHISAILEQSYIVFVQFVKDCEGRSNLSYTVIYCSHSSKSNSTTIHQAFKHVFNVLRSLFYTFVLQ